MMIGGAQRFAVAVAVMSLGTAGTEAAAQAETAMPTSPSPAPWSVVTSDARYVLAHEGGSLRLLDLGRRVAHIWNGRHNCPAHGYAIVYEDNGAFFLVRYAAIGDGATRYTVRHVTAQGQKDLEWKVEIPAAGTTVRQIALMEGPHATIMVTP